LAAFTLDAGLAARFAEPFFAAFFAGRWVATADFARAVDARLATTRVFLAAGLFFAGAAAFTGFALGSGLALTSTGAGTTTTAAAAFALAAAAAAA
jgi:hypothetical protein